MSPKFTHSDVTNKLEHRDQLIKDWAVDYLMHIYPQKSCPIIIEHLEQGKLQFSNKVKQYLIAYGSSQPERLLGLLNSLTDNYWEYCEVLVKLNIPGTPELIKENFINKIPGLLTSVELEKSFRVLSSMNSPVAEWLFGGYYSSLKLNTHQPKLIQQCSRGFMKVVIAEHFRESLEEVFLSLHTPGVTNILCSIVQYIDSDIYEYISGKAHPDLSNYIENTGLKIEPPSFKEYIVELETLCSNKADSDEILTTVVAACADYCAYANIDYFALQEKWDNGDQLASPLLEFVKTINIISYLPNASIKGSSKKTLGRFAVAAYLTLVARGSDIYSFNYARPDFHETVKMIMRQDRYVPEIFEDIAASFGDNIIPELLSSLNSNPNEIIQERVFNIICKLPETSKKPASTAAQHMIDCFVSNERLKDSAFSSLCVISEFSKDTLKAAIESSTEPHKVQLSKAFLAGSCSGDRLYMEGMLGLDSQLDEHIIDTLRVIATPQSIAVLADFIDGDDIIDTERLVAIESSPAKQPPILLDKVEPTMNTSPLNHEAACYFYQDYTFDEVKVFFDQSYTFQTVEPLIVPDKREELKPCALAIATIARVNELEPNDTVMARMWAEDLDAAKSQYIWTGKKYHPRMSMEKQKALKTNGSDILKAKQQSKKKKKKKKKRKK